MNEKQKTLLLVEDEAIIAAMETEQLKRYGYNVISANSGEKAIETFKNNDSIDLILMDINLGKGIDGTSAAEIILKQKEVPIVFLSSHTEPEVVEKTEKITSYGYIVKNSEDTVIIASIKMAFKLFESKKKELEKEKDILINQKRLESIIAILQSDVEDVQEFLDFALSEALKLTDSKLGYIYFYDEDKKEFTLNSWSKEVMGRCKINEPQTIYQLEKTGIWGEAVRQRKPIIVNDFSSPNTLKKGYPEGHAKLYNFLTVPIFFKGKIVAVIGAANKETDYTQTDVLQLSLLMDAVWKNTERKQTEVYLDNQNRLFNTLLDNLPIGVFMVDAPSGKPIIANEKAKELLGRGILPDVNEDNLSTVYEAYKYATNKIYPTEEMPIIRGMFGEKTHIDDMKVVRPDGTSTLIEIYGSPVFDSNNKVVMSLVSFVDITERKKREDDFYLKSLILDQINEYVTITDLNGIIIYVNKIQEQKFKLPRSEIIGKSIHLFGEDSTKGATQDEIITSTLRDGVWEGEIVNYSADGEEQILKSRTQIIYDPKGFPLVLCGISSNITKEKQFLKEITEKEELLRFITENAQDAIFSKNLNREYTYANKEAAKIMGLPVNQIIGKKAEDIFSEENCKQIKETDDLNFQGIPVNVTKELIIDKKIMFLNTSQNPMYNEANEITGITGIVRNETEKIITERKISELLKEKELLLKEVHHRVKNNLSSILSLINLQNDLYNNSNGKGIFQDIISQIKSFQVLYDKLYKSKDFRSISMRDYLESLVNDISAIFAKMNNVKIITEINDIILNDNIISPLGIIINELITNSMKYAFVDKSDATISLTAYKKDDLITIIYEDNGVGIPESVSIDNSTGFGLQLVSLMVNQLDGTIKLIRNSGAKFVIEFKI